MAMSLYSGFVPVCLQLLGGLKTVLQKAEGHATAQKWDTATVLNLRLYPDMFTLERQVRQVCNHALGAGRVAGVVLSVGRVVSRANGSSKPVSMKACAAMA
jgi:hypothetical protein